MRHHYVIYAWMKYDAVCKMGAICIEQDLHSMLSKRDVKGYKVISVDDEPVAGWNDTEWRLL
jgi:hypothetical protein